MIIGYARVSTDGQTLDAQHAALRAAGAEKVYSEKISGTVTDRKALARAVDALGPGDTLVVTRLDRLARSTRDLIAVAGASLRSIFNRTAAVSILINVFVDLFCSGNVGLAVSGVALFDLEQPASV